MSNNERMERMEKMEMIVELATLFNKELIKPVLKLWIKVLDDMRPEELDYAINESVRHSSYMPAIADLWTIVEDRREVKRRELEQVVISWLLKNNKWTYSQQMQQHHADEALVALGMPAGSLDVSEL